MRNANWVAAIVLALAVAGFAQEPGKPEAPAPRHEQGRESTGQGIIFHLIDNPKSVQELGLTEEQVKRIREGADETRKSQMKLRADLELAGVEQAKLLTGDQVDEKSLMQAVEKTGRIRTEMAKLQMKQILLVRNNMTAEQHAKLRKMISRRMEEWAKRSAPRASDGSRDRRERRSGGEEGQDRPPTPPPAADPGQPQEL